MPVFGWSRRRGSYSPSGLAAACRAKMKELKITKRLMKIYASCFIVLFSSAFSITMLFPFLPFMVEQLLPQVEEEDIGKYAGIIASSMFFGRFIGSYVWGAVADVKGRKPVVMLSCLLIGLFSAAFGFSIHLSMAIVFRFGVGLFNGVVGTVKAIISESSNDSNQALGMSILMCSFGFGLVIGPAVSGAVADPIGQYNLTISDPIVRGFLTKFPYSLPCLINLALCLLAVAVLAVWLPETLGTKKAKNPPKDDASKETSVADDTQELLDPETSQTGDDITSYRDDDVILKPDTDLGTANGELAALQDGGSSEHGGSEDAMQDAVYSSDNAGSRRSVSEEECEVEDMVVHDGSSSSNPRMQPLGKRRNSILVPFFNRRASFTPSFFKSSRSMLLQSHQERWNKLAVDENEESLLAQQEEIEMEGESRGEGEREEVSVSHRKIVRMKESLKKALLDFKLFFTTRGTALSLLIYSIFSFAIIGFDEIYSLWAAAAPHLGGLGWTLHEIGISLAISGALFFPFTFLFTIIERRFGAVSTAQMSFIASIICITLLPNIHLIASERLSALRWVLLVLLLTVMRVAVGYVFVATALFINNSVTFDKLGRVNGLGSSLTAALRTIAPVFSGSIFSLSLSKGARSFGFPINYHLIFIIYGVIILLCTSLTACLPLSINRQLGSKNRTEGSGPSLEEDCNSTPEDGKRQDDQ